MNTLDEVVRVGGCKWKARARQDCQNCHLPTCVLLWIYFLLLLPALGHLYLNICHAKSETFFIIYIWSSSNFSHPVQKKSLIIEWLILSSLFSGNLAAQRRVKEGCSEPFPLGHIWLVPGRNPFRPVLYNGAATDRNWGIWKIQSWLFFAMDMESHSLRTCCRSRQRELSVFPVTVGSIQDPPSHRVHVS